MVYKNVLNYRFNWDSWDFILESSGEKEKLINLFQILKIQRQYVIENKVSKNLYFSPIIEDGYQGNISLYSKNGVLIENGKSEYSVSDLKKYFKNSNFNFNNKILLLWSLKGKLAVITSSEGNYNNIVKYINKSTFTHLFPQTSLKWEEKNFNWKKYFSLNLTLSNAPWLWAKTEDLIAMYSEIDDFIKFKNEYLESLGGYSSKSVLDFNSRIENFVKSKNTSSEIKNNNLVIDEIEEEIDEVNYEKLDFYNMGGNDIDWFLDSVYN